jgi:pimeloyl-ACP methyl ester carboxylesterase
MRPFFFFFAIIAFSCTSRKEEAQALPEIYNLGSRIDYEVAGAGDTTLLFVHGWCINKSYWDGQVEHFKDRYKVVTVDLPGHGNSDKTRTDWSIKNFGSDIVLIMEALSLENVVLIGHSMGGNIILEAATVKPEVVIGFVGVDNFKDVGVEYSEEQRLEIDNFISQISEDYEEVVTGFASGMLFAESTKEDIRERVLNDILNTPAEISVGILRSLNSVTQVEAKQMERLRVKLHLINCDGMPTDEIQLRKYCRRSYEVHSIGSLGHYPMIEDTDRFNEILDDVLKSL